MSDLTNRGVAIIVISSDLPELISISDRIMVLHQGSITGQFLRSEFNQENILSCALGTHGEA